RGPSHDVDAANSKVRAMVDDTPRQKPVAGSYVEHGCVPWDKLGEMPREHANPPSVNETAMRDVEHHGRRRPMDVAHQRLRRPRILAKKLDSTVCTPSDVSIAPGIERRSVAR